MATFDVQLTIRPSQVLETLKETSESYGTSHWDLEGLMPGTLSFGLLRTQFVDLLGRTNIARRSLSYGQRLDQGGNVTTRLS